MYIHIFFSELLLSMKKYYVHALIATITLVLFAGFFKSFPKKEFAYLDLVIVREYNNALKKFVIITEDREIIPIGHDQPLLDPRNPGIATLGSTIDASGPVYYEIILDDNSVKKGVILENLKRGDSAAMEIVITKSGDIKVKYIGKEAPHVRARANTVNGVHTFKREYSMVPFED